MNSILTRFLAESRLPGMALGLACASVAMADSSAMTLRYPFWSPDPIGWTQSMPPNDDQSSVAIPLGFTFDFYGQLYDTVWINNNGNLTFSGPLGTYTSSGFPLVGPAMIAPFWADVDTRNRVGADTNLVWHKFVDESGDGVADTLVVTWDAVGYFANHNTPSNTFQVAISGIRNAFGTPSQGAAGGMNVLMSYGEMGWTTGDFSGGAGGFGGTPATVGVNGGTGLFWQFGRFDQPGYSPTGVDRLDHTYFAIDAGNPVSPPSIALVSVTPVTCGLSDGAIDVTVDGAESVSWMGPSGFTSTAVDLSSLASGQYAVTATGLGGSTTFTVSVPAAQDLTPPIITPPATSPVVTSQRVDCVAVVPDLTSMFTATDDCTPADAIVKQQSIAAGTELAPGAYLIYFIAVDASGNSSSVGMMMTVTNTPATFYRDADGDGYGWLGTTTNACAQPSGYVTNATDCNDANSAIHPGAVETCFDHIDNNCNGQVDENCVPFTVLLSGSAPSIAPGDTFIVRAMCTAPAADMGGAQLTLHFDATRLRLDAVDPVAPAGLNLEISEQIDNTAGTLRYALGLSDPSVPLSGAADLCDMTFTVLPGADMCGAAGLVGFGNVGPFTTRFTAAATAAAVVPVLVDLAPVNLDTTAPALAGVPANISVATDAGSTFGALVSLPTVTATDDCDGPVAVTATGIPSGGLFPIGTTTVTWTATDAAGNTATSSRTVTVEPYQLLDAVVSLSNLQLGASRHALRIGTGAAVEVVDTLIPAWSGATPSSATVTVHVPVASSYPCVSAKSVGATVAGGAERASHTLTDTASASVSGSRYRAEFVLLSGDSNDDDMVEILDYGNWLLDHSSIANPSSAAEARSNYNGDNLVINNDFAVIAAYFFRVGESCTQGADAPRHPRDRIHVKELRRMGRGDLAAADLNRDGWVDTRDMQMALQGATPPQHPHSAPDSSASPRSSNHIQENER